MKKNSPLLRYLSFAIISSSLWSSAQAQEKPTHEPKKIVFIAGKASHGPGQHEHRAGSMLLAKHLENAGLGVSTKVVENGWPKDESVLESASAIVIYSDGGPSHPAMDHLDKLRSLAEHGVGIGCIHYAVEIPKGRPGDTFLDSIGGFFETDWSVNPHWDGSFKMIDHPVANGVKDFTIRDEWYYHMRFRKDMEGIIPVLSDLPQADTLTRPNGAHEGNAAVRDAVLEKKEPQHVMWLFDRPEALGGGRGFGFTGGHFHKNWQNDDFRRIVLNAIIWSAGLEIPEGGVATKTPSDEEMTENLDKK